jgi:hypothetical protein
MPIKRWGNFTNIAVLRLQNTGALDSRRVAAYLDQPLPKLRGKHRAIPGV